MVEVSVEDAFDQSFVEPPLRLRRNSTLQHEFSVRSLPLKYFLALSVQLQVLLTLSSSHFAVRTRSMIAKVHSCIGQIVLLFANP